MTIPVMAKCRIGHFVECQIFEEIGADYIDESEVSHTHARNSSSSPQLAPPSYLHTPNPPPAPYRHHTALEPCTRCRLRTTPHLGQVLTMADEDNHVNKNKFNIPFVCGCRNLGEALRRIAEQHGQSAPIARQCPSSAPVPPHGAPGG